MSGYFRRYYEAPDDTGAAVADEVEPDEADGAAEVPVEAPEAPSFSPEDDAEHFGSRFQERFASKHDPVTARMEYAKSVEHLQSAYGRISQGGAPTAEDFAAAEALGIELPQPVEEQVEPIWGAPWAEPDSYEDIEKLALSNPQKALEFIDKQPEGRIDPAFRQQVVAYWASPEGANDHAGALSYEREKARADAIVEAKAYADERFEAMRQEFGDVRQKYEADTHKGHIASVDLLVTRAKADIPDFIQHEPGVLELVKRNVAVDDTYLPRLLALPVEQQLEHFTELTGSAAWRNRPQAQADADAEAQAAEAAKLGAAGQRGRTAAGSSNTAQSDLKRRHLESIERAVKADAHV